MKHYVKDIWDNCLKPDSFFKKIMFNVFYKIHPNFNNYFVNNLSFIFKNSKFIRCQNSLCNICNLTINSSILHNNLNLLILIPSFSTCSSTNCIYILNCVKCKLQYIGQTSRKFNIRMKEHLYNIKYCIENKSNLSNLDKFLINKSDSYFLYKHFSNSDHDIHTDIRFQIFISDCNLFRLRLETDLIYLFNTLYPNGLNSSISNNLKVLSNYKI